MDDIDQTILHLKKEGKSLREIAKALEMGKSTISRKIKAMGHPVGSGTANGTVNVPQKGKCPTSSKPCRSRVAGEDGVVENQGGTVSTPCLTLGEEGIPLRTPYKVPLGGLKGGSEGMSESDGGLFEAIRGFLEIRGVELYRVNCEPEAYQIKDDTQTVKFYVKRNIVKLAQNKKEE